MLLHLLLQLVGLALSFDGEEHWKAEELVLCKRQNKPDCFLSHIPHFRGLKTELYSAEPLVVIFKNFLPNLLLQKLNAINQPYFSLKVVRNGRKVNNNTRIANGTWIMQNTELFDEIAQLFKAYFTIDFNTAAEPLNVISYGSKGHYASHVDFFINETNNRFITILLIVKTPPIGGTIFPRLNISLRYVPGDVVLWKNLKPNGKGDERTLHAGCPIESGEKLIVSAWLNSLATSVYYFEERFILK